MRSTHCLPSYSFGGHDVFDAIPKFTKLYGKSVAIIGGETALSKALPHIRPVLDKAGIKVLDIIHFWWRVYFCSRQGNCTNGICKRCGLFVCCWWW